MGLVYQDPEGGVLNCMLTLTDFVGGQMTTGASLVEAVVVFK